jgi:glycyl-tRNA synthetase beta chain
MANRFALVANMIASDGGKEIVAGNERVLRARLSDAKFFWDEDRKHSLESRVEKLKGIVFHAKLGTQHERVERIERLAGEIAAKIGTDVEKAKRAAQLAKADLTTGVVGEFPELQGVMGRYYAQYDKEDVAVADAIRDHYKPVGPSDGVPIDKVAIAVALADKLDALVGFFVVGEKPTGSSDPFALRRAALGTIRILLENRLRVPLLVPIAGAEDSVTSSIVEAQKRQEMARGGDVPIAGGRVVTPTGFSRPVIELLAFFADRLKVALKEKGVRHDLIDAVFSLGNEDDLVRLVARVEALQAFLKTDDGANLLAGYKRAANILKAEEKKDGKTFISEALESHLAESAEKSLFAALTKARFAIAPLLEQEQFAAAMQQMAALRVPVDAFFEGVKVNADDAAVRENRLNLLASLRATLHQVADFSKIEG